LADLQRTVYPHSGHPSAEDRAQDMVSSPAKDRRSANCATHSGAVVLFISFHFICMICMWQGQWRRFGDWWSTSCHMSSCVTWCSAPHCITKEDRNDWLPQLALSPRELYVVFCVMCYV